MHDNNEHKSYEAFSRSHKLTFEANWVPSRPDGLMGGNYITRHWRCRITSSEGRKRTMSLYFSQGSAHTEPPTLADVLDCIASDAAGYEDAQSFEEWARGYGYDTDSRKAEQTYRAVKRQAEQLKRMIGQEAYEELLWKTERL